MISSYDGSGLTLSWLSSSETVIPSILNSFVWPVFTDFSFQSLEAPARDPDSSSHCRWTQCTLNFFSARWWHMMEVVQISSSETSFSSILNSLKLADFYRLIHTWRSALRWLLYHERYWHRRWVLWKNKGACQKNELRGNTIADANTWRNCLLRGESFIVCGFDERRTVHVYKVCKRAKSMSNNYVWLFLAMVILYRTGRHPSRKDSSSTQSWCLSCQWNISPW